MSHRASVTSLQGCHESHPSTSSPSISQQQNCWFNHQPSEQYPNLRSDSHTLTIEMIAMFIPMHTPTIHSQSTLSNKARHSPTSPTTNQLCPPSTIFWAWDNNHGHVHRSRGLRLSSSWARALRIRLFRSRIESCIQSDTSRPCQFRMYAIICETCNL